MQYPLSRGKIRLVTLHQGRISGLFYYLILINLSAMKMVFNFLFYVMRINTNRGKSPNHLEQKLMSRILQRNSSTESLFFRAILCGFLLLLSIVSVHAQVDEEMNKEQRLSKPLWEFGVFGAMFSTPKYPASDSNDTNFLVTPYVVYRGEVFRVGDGSAVRAVAVEKDWIEVDLSIEASFSSNADDESARVGMPDLDYVFEIGPQVKLKLAKFEFQGDTKGNIILRIQARSAFSTDFSSINHRGFVFHPELTYQMSRIWQQQDRLTLNISPSWATEKLHDYFYQVETEFATATRPPFDAGGGYLGANMSFGYSFSASENVRMFTGVSVNLHNGSANTDSPLFFDNNNYSFGLGVLWRLYESKRMAK